MRYRIKGGYFDINPKSGKLKGGYIDISPMDDKAFDVSFKLKELAKKEKSKKVIEVDLKREGNKEELL